MLMDLWITTKANLTNVPTKKMVVVLVNLTLLSGATCFLFFFFKKAQKNGVQQMDIFHQLNATKSQNP